MSDQEKEEFDAFKDDVKRIKRWYPVVAACLIVAGFFITATHYVDKTIATRSDIDTVLMKIARVERQQIALSEKFDNYTAFGNNERAKIKGSVDSLGGVVKVLQKRVYTRFVTENYAKGRDKDPVIKQAN